MFEIEVNLRSQRFHFDVTNHTDFRIKYCVSFIQFIHSRHSCFVENIWQILNERFSFSQVEDKDIQFLDSMKIARENIFNQCRQQ